MLRAGDPTFPHAVGRPGFRRRFDRRHLPQTLLTCLVVTLLFVLAARHFHRLTTTPVWLATTAIDAGTVIGPSHTSTERLSSSRVRPGMLGAEIELHGKKIYRAKNPGEAFVAEDFQRPSGAPPKTHLSDAVPKGRILMTVKVPSSSIPHKQLRRGDRLDLLTTGRGHGPNAGTRLVAREAFVIGSARSGGGAAASTVHPRLGIDTSAPQRQKKGGGGGTFLLLALHPQDAFTVAEAQNQESPLSVVLHGIHEHRAGEFLNIRPKGSFSTELISGSSRETITFEGHGGSTPLGGA